MGESPFFLLPQAALVTPIFLWVLVTKDHKPRVHSRALTDFTRRQNYKVRVHYLTLLGAP